MSEEENKIDKKNYPAIIKSLRSPLSVFGLAMLICNAVFSLSAAIMNNLEAFIYSIHTFLAIVFSFVIIAIWSPRSLYHPSELAGMEKELPEIKNSRLIITVVLLVSAFTYAIYQFNKDKNVDQKMHAVIIELQKTEMKALGLSPEQMAKRLVKDLSK